jgi:6-phosphogluconolactonase
MAADLTGAEPAGFPRLLVLPTAADVEAAAAEEVARALAEAVADRGVAHWATTGGSMAPGLYRHLATAPLRDAVPWDRVQTWWGDDRFVPQDHPLSNVRSLHEVLAPALTGRLPEARLHPVPVEPAIAVGADARWAAARYAEELLAAGPPPDAAGAPVLDLVILGVGPDGHVLSVFPGSAVWDEPALCVAVPAPTHVEPHVERVTLHPRVLGAARRVLVVAAGAPKAGVLDRAWTGHDVRELPVRAARRRTATWILDEAAAAGLPRR